MSVFFHCLTGIVLLCWIGVPVALLRWRTANAGPGELVSTCLLAITAASAALIAYRWLPSKFGLPRAAYGFHCATMLLGWAMLIAGSVYFMRGILAH